MVRRLALVVIATLLKLCAPAPDDLIFPIATWLDVVLPEPTAAAPDLAPVEIRVITAVELLEKFLEQGVVTPHDINASLYMLELIAVKSDLSLADRLYEIVTKLLLASTHNVERCERWIHSLSLIVSSIPSDQHHLELAHNLCARIFDDFREFDPFVELLANTLRHFTSDEARRFLQNEIMSNKSIPHLEMFAARIAPGERFDFLDAICTEIASKRMLLFPNRKGNKFRFGWRESDKQMDRIRSLNVLARQFHLQAPLIDAMLEIATVKHDQSREFYYISLQMMGICPEIVQSNLHLIFKLFRLSKIRCVSKRGLIRKMIARLPDRCFRHQDEDGRSLFQAFIESRMEEIDIRTNQLLQEKTPPELLYIARSRMLSVLEPELWEAVFAGINRESIRAWGYLNFFDIVLAANPNRQRLEVIVVLAALNRGITDEEHDKAMQNWDPFLFIHNCRNVIERFSVDSGRSVLHLMQYFQRHKFLDKVINRIPSMFATPETFAQFVAFLAEFIGMLHNQPVINRDTGGALSNTIGTNVLVGLRQAPWFGDAFVRLFTFHFRYDDLLLSRAKMNMETCIASLYILSRSVDESKSKPFNRLLGLVEYSLKQALMLKSDRKNRALVESIIVLSLKIANQIRAGSFRLVALELGRFPPNLLKKPFRALWRDDGFEKFAEALFDEAHTLRRSRPHLSLDLRPPPLAARNPQLGQRRLRIRQIKSIEDDYEIVDQIGHGTYGTVYKARIGDQVVAIKKMGLYDDCADSEVDFMTKFCHSNQIPGLVQLLDVARTQHDIYLVMELIEGRRLFDWQVPDDSVQALKDVIVITYQIALILHRMHELNWMHGDISHTGNFLIEKDTEHLVLIDFGFARPAKCGCADGQQMYERFNEILLKVKEKFHMVWYQSSPEPMFGAFEKMLERMKHRYPLCDDFLSDPVFRDCNPDLFCRRTSQSLLLPIKREFEEVGNEMTQLIPSSSMKDDDDDDYESDFDGDTLPSRDQDLDCYMDEYASSYASWRMPNAAPPARGEPQSAGSYSSSRRSHNRVRVQEDDQSESSTTSRRRRFEIVNMKDSKRTRLDAEVSADDGNMAESDQLDEAGVDETVDEVITECPQNPQCDDHDQFCIQRRECSPVTSPKVEAIDNGFDDQQGDDQDENCEMQDDDVSNITPSVRNELCRRSSSCCDADAPLSSSSDEGTCKPCSRGKQLKPSSEDVQDEATDSNPNEDKAVDCGDEAVADDAQASLCTETSEKKTRSDEVQVAEIPPSNDTPDSDQEIADSDSGNGYEPHGVVSDGATVVSDSTHDGSGDCCHMKGVCFREKSNMSSGTCNFCRSQTHSSSVVNDPLQGCAKIIFIVSLGSISLAFLMAVFMYLKRTYDGRRFRLVNLHRISV